ncbi:unnamed protein product, partial [Symbiodinium sp. KB8]
MYARRDDEGRVHDITQAEGVEQSDPPAPGLDVLGPHDSLVAASASLWPDERLAAFLDDLYVVTVPERAAPLLRVVTGDVERGAGVVGKTQVFNADGGDAPPGVDVLDPDVWCGPGEGDDWAAARQVAFLPPSLGGLSLLAAERVSPAACWAAWADAVPVLRQRYLEAAARLVQELEGEPAAHCLRAAAEGALHPCARADARRNEAPPSAHPKPSLKRASAKPKAKRVTAKAKAKQK